MYKHLFLFFLLISTASAQLRVGILDTGLNLKDPRSKSHICKTGSVDITHTTLDDVNGHGTAIAGLIVSNAKNSDYCFIIVKYYQDIVPYPINNKNFRKGLNYLVNLHPDIINISSQGPGFSEEEYLDIIKDLNITFVTSAGNDGKKLIGEDCSYPACYTSLNNIVVGSINEDGLRTTSSNYGDNVHVWEVGENVRINLPLKKCENNCQSFSYGSGTSFSAAIHTGKLIYERSH